MCSVADHVITPETVYERMEDDMAVADLVLWVGISFQQSASTQYFRNVSASAPPCVLSAALGLGTGAIQGAVDSSCCLSYGRHRLRCRLLVQKHHVKGGKGDGLLLLDMPCNTGRQVSAGMHRPVALRCLVGGEALPDLLCSPGNRCGA
jgi:hypothetical protein